MFGQLVTRRRGLNSQVSHAGVVEAGYSSLIHHLSSDIREVITTVQVLYCDYLYSTMTEMSAKFSNQDIHTLL